MCFLILTADSILNVVVTDSELTMSLTPKPYKKTRSLGEFTFYCINYNFFLYLKLKDKAKQATVFLFFIAQIDSIDNIETSIDNIETCVFHNKRERIRIIFIYTCV